MSVRLKRLRNVRRGPAPGVSGHRARHAAHDYPSAFISRARPDVYDPVAREDHIEIVLDDHHRVAELDQPLQLREQLLNVRRMQCR